MSIPAAAICSSSSQSIPTASDSPLDTLPSSGELSSDSVSYKYINHLHEEESSKEADLGWRRIVSVYLIFVILVLVFIALTVVRMRDQFKLVAIS